MNSICLPLTAYLVKINLFCWTLVVPKNLGMNVGGVTK